MTMNDPERRAGIQRQRAVDLAAPVFVEALARLRQSGGMLTIESIGAEAAAIADDFGRRKYREALATNNPVKRLAAIFNSVPQIGDGGEPNENEQSLVNDGIERMESGIARWSRALARRRESDPVFAGFDINLQIGTLASQSTEFRVEILEGVTVARRYHPVLTIFRDIPPDFQTRVLRAAGALESFNGVEDVKRLVDWSVVTPQSTEAPTEYGIAYLSSLSGDPEIVSIINLKSEMVKGAAFNARLLPDRGLELLLSPEALEAALEESK